MSTAVDERADAPEAEGPAFEAPALLRVLWTDPHRMAEHLAVWSLDRFGPRAGTMLEKISAGHPDADRAELERLVTERQTRVAVTEGAFVGGPFIVLIPVAFCAALLAQAQMVYAIAAVAGRDPADRMRAAELLVLLGAYASADEANAALATMTWDVSQHEGGKLPAGTRIDMVRRMAYLLGVLGTGDGRGRLRAALGWVGIVVLFLVGLVLPLVWVPYMAYATRRSTLRIAGRARAYYASASAGAAVASGDGEEVRFGGLAGLARTAVLVVLPIGAAVVALLTDVSFGSGRWVSAGLLLIALSALTTLAWFGFRWWRHGRTRRTTP